MTLPTTINDISDLSRILQENPEWREHFRALLLTPEILELPAIVAALAAELREFIAEQRQWNEQQRQWNEQQQRWNEEQQRWNEEQKKTNEAIFARFDRVEADISQLKSDVNQLKGDVSQIKGQQAEGRTHRNIHNLLQEHHPDLRRVVVLKSEYIQFATELSDRIDDAEDEGLITLDERKALRAVDLIVRARRRNSLENIYFAIEVSRTVNNNDVRRAANRAQILSRIMKDPGIGVVIGGSVIPQAANLAREMEVSVITSSRLAA